MIYPEIKLAQSIIQICKQKNIQHIIISPGSRNAPLTIGFASDPFFTCYSIADERCAGFFGLGIAKEIQYPTALVCTSGSALLNYYPSISEAFYSQIPLVVISADRPLSKIDIGDGQTIRQDNVYANHILYNASLQEEQSQENDVLINNAINSAIAQRGPVHINAPFEEPLYQTTQELYAQPTIIDLVKIDPLPVDYPTYGQKWQQAKKKLILIGCDTPFVLKESIINSLANDPSVVVLCQTTSNIYDPSFIINIDRFISGFTQEDFENFQCDILLTFGGMVISKHIKRILRQYKPKEHWHVDLLRHYDTFGVLSGKIIDTPERFLSNMTSFYATSVNSGYKQWASIIESDKHKKQEAFLAQAPWSDLKAFDLLMRHFPEQVILQLSNSSVPRYAQLIPSPKSVTVYANRGTSGIDGSTSTAIGCAVVAKQEVILISGDVSFFYDSNALWNNYIPNNFKIILLNNKGGGIFRFLPGHQNTQVFNTYFETSHELSGEHLAKMYNFQYYKANDSQELEQSIESFFAIKDSAAILEICTPTQINDEVLRQYFASF